MGTVAFLVQRIGPYHHVRLRAFALRATHRLIAIEFRPSDAVYAWEAVREDNSYDRVQTHAHRALCAALNKIRPDVVVCVGYADPEVQQTVDWALRHRVPLITCSDSTFDDEPRFRVKEAFKRQVVAAFDSALVAGRRARDYLSTLGMDPNKCFVPWDVVDNSYFAQGAARCRIEANAVRAKLGLPERYFLCVARFVPKKNLTRLIEAFAQYSMQARGGAWSLVLAGSGPLESELRAQIASAGLDRRVVFSGFLQYRDLPACYGLASALVLPSLSDQWGLVVNEAMASGIPVIVSSRCGCIPELLREGENGFGFEPENIAGLAAAMAQIAELDPEKWEAMGRRSREIVAAFTPDAFAAGLDAAIACATTRQTARAPGAARLLYALLSLRPIRRS